MSYPTLYVRMMQNVLEFRDSPIIPLRRSLASRAIAGNKCRMPESAWDWEVP